MKFAILSFALLAVVAADVSHLNNKYLPPVLSGLSSGHSHVAEYAQQNHEIPQLAEVTDNSVVDDVSAEKDVKTTVEIGETTEEVAAPGSDVYQSTQQQAAYWTQQSQQQEPEKQYYTGLIIPEHHTAAATVAEHHVETVAPAAPGSDVYESTQQQAAYFTQQSQQQEPEKQYYTGFNYPQGSAAVETAISTSSDDSTQQHAAYHTQQHTVVAAAPSSGVRASSGIETQYATDGGYVY